MSTEKEKPTLAMVARRAASVLAMRDNDALPLEWIVYNLRTLRTELSQVIKDLEASK